MKLLFLVSFILAVLFFEYTVTNLEKEDRKELQRCVEEAADYWGVSPYVPEENTKSWCCYSWELVDCYLKMYNGTDPEGEDEVLNGNVPQIEEMCPNYPRKNQATQCARKQ